MSPAGFARGRNEGYSEEADRLRSKARDGRSWLLEYEKGERERTGIKSLRIGYNRNFGYYIEVTRPNLELVPAEYRRRQTLVNAERFVTEELTEMEEEITGAGKTGATEYRLLKSCGRWQPLLPAAGGGPAWPC